jgi:drug/metabolite transporter (DMT)-like permease
VTVLFGLSAAFSWAFASVFVQKSSRLVDLRVMLVVMLLISTCLVVPVALIVDGLQGPFNIQALAIPA